MYYKISLLDNSIVSGPAMLPPELQGLNDATLANLCAAINPCPTRFEGFGYWPQVLMAPPAFNPDFQYLTGTVNHSVDASGKRVVDTPVVANKSIAQLSDALAPTNARGLIRRQADALAAKGEFAKALFLLKNIGE